MNKYINGLLELIRKNHDSVECLEMTPHEKFDMLLTENVVFLNLIDVSAANTVIECIVRNTPICINRLPALEEYLGQDYPMFYDTLEEAYNKLSNKKLIKATHKYLKCLKKEKFTINYFLQKLVNSDFYMMDL